jgi:metal-responsive CopG/Arc/MetJ family transcriptional regulator
MNTTKDNTQTMVTSVRLPKDMLDKVDVIAKERLWSRNKTILFLLSQQVQTAQQEKKLGESK